MVIGAILIDKRDGSSQKLSSVKLQSNFDEAVKLISRLRSNYSSIHGLRYRSMICTIARNNPHIAEFLLRNIISGFSHIVVYDNNRILAGYDSNISTVLEPFIAAGVVTHVPWQQNTTKLLQFKYQQTQAKECITKYGIHADWVAYIDTDEFFYFEKQNVAANTLNDLLVELEQHPLCAIGIRWIYMYGEGRMLRPNRTLFESYPRICKTGLQKKVLGRANQGFPPYMVSPIQYYTYTEKVVCDIMEFNYSQDYRRIFINAYKQLKMLYSLTPIDLLPSSGLNLNQTSFHALSMHLQYRCAKKQEFDNERYLTINPGAKEAIRNRTYTDGLHHFMATFSSGAKGCWKTDTYSICE
ncbi:unnamed protein product [Rotaria sordida]|uniref:Glycosyltransferase family 92 protein n=1 Tax=Rotaria sordida TaxID=392033 RepID=A0A819RIQ6_9BILA|nr:unnamed protein product [Rotaria sordida]